MNCSILSSDTKSRNQIKQEAIHNKLYLKNMNWENVFKLHSPAGQKAGFLQGQDTFVSSWGDTPLPVLL
jgi:hypothetical protein